MDQTDSTNKIKDLEHLPESDDKQNVLMRWNVVAVVVTYNRLNLLKETINSLRVQTTPVSKIVVVNNDSTDGTKEWLDSQKNMDVIHQENVGGAGGFETGMKRAFEIGADWLWTMDDDVAPRPDALEVMLKYTSISQCIMPTRLYSDGVTCRWGYIYDFKRRGIVFGTRVSEQDNSKDFTTINTCCFEGMLVSRALVSKIGFPDRRFFIVFDDTVYGLQASRYTNVIVVRDAVFVRAKTYKDSKKLSPMFAYHRFRNYHLIKEYYVKFSGGKRYGLLGELRYFQEIMYFLFCAIRGDNQGFWSVLKAMSMGIIDSMRKLKGKSFR